MTERRFPPPWSVDDIGAAFVVRDHNGQALAYIYFEDEPQRRTTAKMLTKDGERRIAINIAKLPTCCAERNCRQPVSEIARVPNIMISKTVTPDRSKIIIEQKDHVKYWTRHFGVTEDELTHAIQRVGNSAAAVRKQFASSITEV